MSVLLVAYDITDDRRRTRVTKLLARHGRRVQYSVFVLPDATAEEIAAEVTPLILEKEDNVRIHPLCATCGGKTVMLGVAGSRVVDERAFRVI